MKEFKDYTYDDALKLFGKDRRSKTAITASKFRDGDHYQDGEGYLGEMPPPRHPSYEATRRMIEAGFISENVIGEVVENHDGGLFGREPIWSFVQVDGTKKVKIDEAEYGPLTVWWNDRERLLDLQKAIDIALCEEIAVKRIFLPRGLVGDTGELPTQADLAAALEFIYCETLTADKAGVFTDPDTQKQIGIYFYEKGEENAREKWAELTYLDDEGKTVVRRVSKDREPQELTYDLGGRLLIYEIRRKALITTQVQSNQRALNLAHTMMMRNVNLAGARERTVANAQHPKSKKKVADANSPTGTKVIEEDGVYVTGGGAVNFLLGYPIYGENGKVIGYTNPNVTITDPAPVEIFKETRDQLYAAILSQCQQTHKLISADATASGASREQARAEYESSLKKSKIALDAAGRWEIETVWRLAAVFTGESANVLKFRADFNCLISVGVPDPERIKTVMEMRKPGGATDKPLICDETARNWCGVDDAEAELKKIEAEATDAPTPDTTTPAPLLEDKTGEERTTA